MTNTTKQPWIQYWLPKQQAKLRLFCFPYAGGSASIFRSFSESLPPEIEVWPVQLPGRESRLIEPAFSHIDSLVEALEAALLPHLQTPYAFFGHSMGALICFELVRALKRHEHAPAPLHLLVSGYAAPHLPRSTPPVHHLPNAAFIKQLRHLQGTPEEVLNHAELLELLLPTLRADFAVCETYTYAHEPPLDCPITAFGGLRDGEVSVEGIYAWREQTRASFHVHLFDSDHFFIHKEQPSLLSLISHDLLASLRQ